MSGSPIFRPILLYASPCCCSHVPITRQQRRKRGREADTTTHPQAGPTAGRVILLLPALKHASPTQDAVLTQEGWMQGEQRPTGRCARHLKMQHQFPVASVTFISAAPAPCLLPPPPPAPLMTSAAGGAAAGPAHPVGVSEAGACCCCPLDAAAASTTGGSCCCSRAVDASASSPASTPILQ